MTTQSLNRRDRRAKEAKAGRIYGLRGPQALDLHEAYNALARGEVAQAVSLAHPVTQSHPRNPHGWVVMGGAALAQREGATAMAFFDQAAAARPGDPLVLAGQAKAHLLQAEVEQSVARAAEAFAAGSRDAGLVGLYMDLMGRLGRRLVAADLLGPVVAAMKDAALCHRLAEMLMDADEPGAAAFWYDCAWDLDPAPEPHRLGRLRALVQRCRFDEAEALADQLMGEVADRDSVVSLRLLMLRAQRRHDEAEALAEAHDFASPGAYAHSRGVMANIHQDRGDYAAADAAYLEAIHVTGDAGRIAKAYGAFRFRDGDYAGGRDWFARRFPESQRARIPVENAAPEALAALDRVVLMGEQGIGDQLALLPLLRLAPLRPGARVELVSDRRMGPLLAGNGLGVAHRDQKSFLSEPQRMSPQELVYLGDLTRYLEQGDPAQRQGAYLVPDTDCVAALRAAYAAQGGGVPIIGVAWRSLGLSGYLRSIPLAELLPALPEGALVVSLQYGDMAEEIAAAQALRPDLAFVTDPSVDQMADLAGFAAQVAAMDAVATIDNTTAHMAGALGHPAAHLLVPAGSECMWYWGREGAGDPWYGVLQLHRQPAPGEWGAPLASLRAALAGQSASRASM
ncbi:hypothetical protein E0K89_013290 [Aquicoccus sp. SCR17]|nr:hypothetical protein [Carideicomes alvinocaridis]